MDISFMEMLVIALIAFVVLGPTELVKRAEQLGRFVGKLKTEMNNFKVLTREELLKREAAPEIKSKGSEALDALSSTNPKPEDHG